MSWAAKRRLTIALIVGSIIVAILAVTLIATLYKTPTCSDGVQNQDETGIDCGGSSCSYLCNAQEQAPTVLFTKTLINETGRTDIVASVVNHNTTAAAKNVPYTIRLYGNDQVLLQSVSGTVDLPPGATVSVFLSGVTTTKQPIANAFLTIDPEVPHWYTLTSDPRILPKEIGITLSGTKDNPRIDAQLANPSVKMLSNVAVVAIVRDSKTNEVIAASQTVIPLIPSQGSGTALFTWNKAFSSASTTIEVVPIMPLP